MFIKSFKITNYRLFPADTYFEIPEINIPDGNDGSGLTILAGENGTGKTTILDAIALPFLPYKADDFSIEDLNDQNKRTEIIINADRTFEFDGIMPKVKYKGKGFLFEGSIRSKSNTSYFSSLLVNDSKFIRADGEEKPLDGSPDLRININNPYKGSRFKENDYLYLDKNCVFHIRTGTYNKTRFDRLMEDLDFQYITDITGNPEDLADLVFNKVRGHFKNQFLSDALNKFKDISGYTICLDLIHNWSPFSNNAFFSFKAKNNLQVNLSSLGSGYEMTFSLIYSYYLAKQSGRKLIVLMDEPELHLHPNLQNKLIQFLLDISRDCQIVLATQSPLLIKQVASNDRAKIYILHRNNNNSNVEIAKMEEMALPYISADEINFIAFRLPTIEYHNELYSYLHFEYGRDKGIQAFDNDFFINKCHESKIYPWRGNKNEVSLHTFIRNQIHHPDSNTKIDINNLELSIQRMREIILTYKT